MSVRKGSLLLVTLALLGAACSDASADTTTTATADTSLAPSTTAAAATTTTAPAATTSEPPTTTTPTTSEAPSDRVGDPALLEQEIAAIVEEIDTFYEELTLEAVPIPDVTHPDPITAAQELNAFVEWRAANYPSPDWVPITSYPGSPSFEIAEDVMSISFDSQYLRIRPEEPWTFSDWAIVDLNELSLEPETLAGMPEDAVGVMFTSSAGPQHLIKAETGDLIEVVSPGWKNQASLQIVAPTDAGWRTWQLLLDFGGTA